MATAYLKSSALTFSFLAVVVGQLLTNALAGESDPIVASVDSVPIRLSYVYRHIEALPLGDQIDVRDQLERFTESVIKQEMLFRYAQRQLDEDAEFREEIKTIMISHLLDKQVKSRIDISDKLVEAYYRDNRDEISGEHWRVYHLPLKTDGQCEALVPSITSKSSFVASARKYSIDPVLASRGGDLGYVMRHDNILGLGEKLFALPLHKIHKINNQDGCHLIWINEHLISPVPALNEVRDQIYQTLLRRQEVSLLEALLERAAKDIVVERFTATNNTAQDTAMSDVATANQ